MKNEITKLYPRVDAMSLPEMILFEKKMMEVIYKEYPTLTDDGWECSVDYIEDGEAEGEYTIVVTEEFEGKSETEFYGMYKGKLYWFSSHMDSSEDMERDILLDTQVTRRMNNINIILDEQDN